MTASRKTSEALTSRFFSELRIGINSNPVPLKFTRIYPTQDEPMAWAACCHGEDRGGGRPHEPIITFNEAWLGSDAVGIESIRRVWLHEYAHALCLPFDTNRRGRCDSGAVVSPEEEGRVHNAAAHHFRFACLCAALLTRYGGWQAMQSFGIYDMQGIGTGSRYQATGNHLMTYGEALDAILTIARRTRARSFDSPRGFRNEVMKHAAGEIEKRTRKGWRSILRNKVAQ